MMSNKEQRQTFYIRSLEAELSCCRQEIKELNAKIKELEQENKKLWTDNYYCAVTICKVLADVVSK